MKRVQGLILVTSFVAAMAMAAETNVSSVNVVGYTKVTVPSNGLTLVSLNLESVSGAAMCISNLVGEQLPIGSYAFIWDRNANSYIQASKLRGASGWGTNGVKPVLRGDAFWLQVPGAVATQAQYQVVFSGEVPDSTLEATTTVYTILGVDAVGYPYPADIYWTNTVLGKRSVIGEVVYIWTGSNYVNYTRDRAGWAKAGGGYASNLVIRLGQGFWFSTTNLLNWSEVVSYNLHN